MSNDTKDQCAIFVSSCDTFQDAWEPFFTLFFRYWPDCPFKIYLISNTKSFADPRVETILISPDRGWASNIKLALEKNPHPFFIYLQEDYFLRNKVDTERILHLAEILVKEQAACLRLWPSPGPDTKFKDYDNLGLIDINAAYRVSTQAAFWDTKIFCDLLEDGAMGREMEFGGTERSKSIRQPFLSVTRSRWLNLNNRPALNYYCTGIVKGKWNWGVINFLKNEGIVIDINKRAVEPLFRYFSRELRSAPIIGGGARLIFKIIGKLSRELKK